VPVNPADSKKCKIGKLQHYSPGQPRKKARPCLQKHKKGWWSGSISRMPAQHKALSSNSSITLREREREKEREREVKSHGR
jgi:hypothetical protein